MAAVGTVASHPPSSCLAAQNHQGKQMSRWKKDDKPGDVWATLDRELPKPLDGRFADVKKRFVTRENYAAVQDSWDRLLVALKSRAAEIEIAGPDFVPTVDFASIGSDGMFPQDIADLIRSRGCCVVRGVVGREQALEWKSRLIDYVKRHPAIAGNPLPPQDPQWWKVYWTKPQLLARSHPSIIACQTAMSKLFSCGRDIEIDLSSQALYADRFRVRHPGDSRTLPAHLDNGSIERWEDEENSKTFQVIWEGKWEEYDAWNMDHRAQAVIDLYGGPGSCSAFRSIQGWLSLADNAPRQGTLQLLPDIRLSTAYILLRPFFDKDDMLDMESTYFYGADPGMGQAIKDSWHPGLFIDKTIVSAPKAAPGDYVFWHCDMVHKVEETHGGTSDSSVAYIPVVPLTAYNIGNLVEQRKAFLEGVPPPDMVSRDGEEQEKHHADRGKAEDILSVEGRRIMGLERFNTEEEGLTPGQSTVRALANKALGF
ncbi:hypothetical protein QTJ16_003104 [Diplocarpon rosae]|uniref:DUF1479-domain-containing protein n=1 Tax=Diplocarpon rosae TaxID=946125 RepID=A0AAD9WEC2_9HELO|nr:hypothetical protein QTJ16_003104 [Diplocarpon rosae]